MRKRLRGISPQRLPGLQRLLRGAQVQNHSWRVGKWGPAQVAPGWGPPPVPQPAEQRGRRRGPALRPLLTGQDVGGRTAPVSPSGGGARACLVFGAPWDGSPRLVGQRLARRLWGLAPSAAHRPAQAQPVAQALLPSLRWETRDPAASPLCSCHLQHSRGLPFSLEAWLQRGSQPACASLPGPRVPGTQRFPPQRLPSGSGRRRSGHTQQGYQHY